MDHEQQELLRFIWGSLGEATTKRTSFTLAYLATVDANNAPRLRGLILRGFDAEEGSVSFTTNTKSAKADEIRRNPLVALAAIDSDAGVQLRMDGRAEIVEDPAERQRAWDALGPQTRVLYRSPLTPGAPLESNPGTDSSAAHSSESKENAEFERFAWVRVRLEQLDWLDISSKTHKRCRFIREGNHWASEWIAP
ncbi:pyridoxamine 5'-phosphate oxidase family protein [Arthrobacter sp. NPDC056727]|uniref:pyridoxamine 5'-phosphate oxidase family protein n=1 Tax=Arthrobacter sp. NPDC056727 TaxID=3345927 RepID=UPI00366F9CA4